MRSTTKDLRYIEAKDEFLDYSFLALGHHFDSRADFNQFFNSIKSDIRKSLFLRTASFYLFLVKRGDWVVDIDKPNPNEWMPVTEDLNFPVVYFGYNQDRLGESGRTKLKRVATYMTEQERVGLIIQGHSDERGSDEYNRALSERRAIAVRDYLVSSGIQNVRVRTIGYGEERPAVSGDSMSSMAKNRRAQLVPAYIP